MIIIIALLVLLVLLVAHLIILPLSKKRPVFIKGFEGSFFILIFFAAIAAIIHPAIYIFALAVAMFIYYTKSWIVYGVSPDNVSSAFERAILASRAISIKVFRGYQVDNSMLVRIYNLGLKVCYIQYKSKTDSKKAELTKDIFRKFMQNYYIYT